MNKELRNNFGIRYSDAVCENKGSLVLPNNVSAYLSVYNGGSLCALYRELSPYFQEMAPAMIVTDAAFDYVVSDLGSHIKSVEIGADRVIVYEPKQVSMIMDGFRHTAKVNYSIDSNSFEIYPLSAIETLIGDMTAEDASFLVEVLEANRTDYSEFENTRGGKPALPVIIDCCNGKAIDALKAVK